MSISGVFPPLCDPLDGHLLIDGCYLDNVPGKNYTYTHKILKIIMMKLLVVIFKIIFFRHKQNNEATTKSPSIYTEN